MAGQSSAVEYSVDGSLGLNQIYNSNIILSTPAKDAFGTSLDGIANLAAREQNWEVGGRARVSQFFYYPVSGIDMTNIYLDGNTSYLTERSRFSLAGNYTDAWYLASDAQAEDITGFVLARVRRDSQSISPSWTYALDELTTATLGYSYVHGEFGFGGGGSSLQNSHTAFSSLARRIDEQMSTSLELSYSHSGTSRDSPSYTTRNEYVNAMLGLDYRPNETLQFAASAGAQYSRTENESDVAVFQGYALVDLDPVTYVPIVQTVRVQSQPPPRLAPLFKISARKRFETSELNLNYSRQISPSFNGLLLEVDRVAASGSRKLTEFLTGSLGMSYYTQSYSGDTTNGGLPSFSGYSLDGSLSYRWSPQWSATASYRYLHREIDPAKTDSDAHSVFIGLRYDFDKLGL